MFHVFFYHFYFLERAKFDALKGQIWPLGLEFDTGTLFLHCTSESLGFDVFITGNYCRGAFDTFACWPHSLPGNVSIPCPAYLPWITEGSTRRLYRQCLEDGRWRQMENSSEPWREDSECLEDHYFKDKVGASQTALRLVSIIGYSLSLFSLTLATLLIGLLRKLHCTRNYIHMNLFVSFMLRAIAVISKEIILYIMYSNLPKDDPGWNSYSSSAVRPSVSHYELILYFVACNYFWLLVEAIFLHTLLFTAALTKRRLLKKYMLLGWGETWHQSNTPLTFSRSSNLAVNTGKVLPKYIGWPYVIFYIFIKILMLLLSKLKADQVKFTDYRYSLARATLVLIPLLGIHEVVFTVLIDESVEGSSRYAKNFVNLTLSSFQVKTRQRLSFVLKVQAEVKKRWQLFLLTNHFRVTSCFQGSPLKYLWRCTCGQHLQSEPYDERSASPMNPHFLQVAVPGQGRGRRTEQVKGQGKSLSSSDGEMTLGETMEEILEESKF
uniref:Glucagon like peptide 2 receptor n=1 Tax=Gouania willdenowi TaxID=441366 RepID=A0A8C5EX18_GOUWI